MRRRVRGQGRGAVALQGGGEFGGEVGAPPIERGEVEGVLQEQAAASTLDADGSGEKNDGGGRRLCGALEPVPKRGWRAPQLKLIGAAQIDEHESDVAVANDDVGHVKRRFLRGAAHPQQVRKHIGVGAVRVEAFSCVDEDSPQARAARGSEEGFDQQLSAAGRCLCHEFAQGAGGKPPAEGGVKGLYTCGEKRLFPARGGGKSGGEQLPQFGHGTGNGHVAASGWGSWSTVVSGLRSR